MNLDELINYMIVWKCQKVIYEVNFSCNSCRLCYYFEHPFITKLDAQNTV